MRLANYPKMIDIVFSYTIDGLLSKCKSQKSFAQ